jgi:predicted ABC-type ATPase
MPNLYIIAGCNGAGKTTASLTVLPEVLHCHEFVNADNIAKGLSPFNVEGVAFEAGRIMINRLNELVTQKKDFALETTLASKSYVSFINKVKEKGYEVYLIFFWLNSVELAKSRVNQRVEEGGHNIPTDIIERRYKAGIKNFKLLYKDLVSEWEIYDNSFGHKELIAERKKDQEVKIFAKEKYHIFTL